jgi:pimeloyl-ACP methyl ester carboxylesterase
MMIPNSAGYAPVNGIKMYYEVYGEGAIPLVLIHGGGSTIETSFGNILPYLSDYGKLITLELQAHGRTEDRTTPESFEQDADDVIALLEYLKIEKAVFLGFSNGGTTTLQIAIRKPAIVHKIVVVAGLYKREGLLNGFFDGFPDVTVEDMPAQLRDAFLKVTPDEEKLQLMFEKDKARMMQFKDIPDDLIAAIQVPALIMVSDKDVVTVEHTLQLSYLIKHAQLVVLPGVHGSFLGEICVHNTADNTDIIAASALIKAFLNKP